MQRRAQRAAVAVFSGWILATGCAAAAVAGTAPIGDDSGWQMASDAATRTAPDPAAGAAEGRTPVPIPAAAMQQAQTIFTTRCALCHGAGGKGDGPAGAALSPRPRDMTDQAWQQSVSDEHIEQIIAGGGAAVGKSPMMPANPDLANKPDVIKALRQLVRGFQSSAK
jgi:mono/diheme cytochrome c family protein